MKKLSYSVPEARAQLGNIGHDLFYKLVRSGELRLTKIGRRSVVTEDALREYLRKRAA